MKFSQETADLVTFTEEILNRKLHLCAVPSDHERVSFDFLILSIHRTWYIQSLRLSSKLKLLNLTL